MSEDLPSYTAEKLTENFPNRIDYNILSGPYTPTYLIKAEIDKYKQDAKRFRGCLMLIHELFESYVTFSLINKLAHEFKVSREAVKSFFMGGDAPGVKEFHRKLVDSGYNDGGGWIENSDWFKRHDITKLEFDTVILANDFDLELDNHHKTIKDILFLIKNGDYDLAKAYIELVKDDGWDYPELSAMEKSLK